MKNNNKSSSNSKNQDSKKLLQLCSYIENTSASNGDCKLRAANLKRKVTVNSCDSEEIINDLIIIIDQLTRHSERNTVTSDTKTIETPPVQEKKDKENSNLVKDTEKAIAEVFKSNNDSPIKKQLLDNLQKDHSSAFSIMKLLVNYAMIEGRKKAEKSLQLMLNIEGAASTLISQTRDVKDAEKTHIKETVDFINDIATTNESLKNEIDNDNTLSNPKVAGIISSIEEQLTAQAINQKAYQEKAQSLLTTQQKQVDNLLKETHILRRQLEDTKKLAETDQLTTLKNRRSFDIKRSENARLNKEYTYAIIDIDFFKKINDKYGHSAGDMVLKSFSSILKSISSSSVHPYRIGGEEFGVIIDGEYNVHHLSLMRYIRASAEKNICNTPEGKISYTVSIGQSTTKEGKKFLEIADKRLYKSKENGRNRITYK